MRDRDRKEAVNPAARRDAPREPHDDLVKRSEEEREREPPKSYQDAELDPRDQGGIAE